MTEPIYAVVNNGQYFDRKALDALLEKAKQVKQSLDKERGD